MPKLNYGEEILKKEVQKKRVRDRLKEKYPQMFKPGWGKSKKKGILRRIKNKVTTRTKDVEAAASSQMGKRESLGEELTKLRRKSKGK